MDHQKRPLLLFIMSRMTDRAKRQLLDFEFESWDELKERLKSRRSVLFRLNG